MKRSIIVKGLLFALVGGVVIVAPGAIIPLGALAKFLIEAQNAPAPVHIPQESDPQKVRASIYYLRRNEYMKIKRIGEKKFKFELTKKGKKLLAQYNYSDFQLKPKRPWDSKWRMFVFDVPEKNRTARDILRDKLKKLGFFRFQKSVWIYPFECEEEMRYICEFLYVQPYTLMFTGKIHNDKLLRKYFIREGMLATSDLYRAS